MTTPPSTAFPELPALVAEYAVKRTTEVDCMGNPPPWDLGALPEEVRAPLLSWLDQVCRWLNHTYAWQPHQVIPPCWREHEHLSYEIAAFAFTRTDANDEPGAAIIWHEQYDRFLHRMNNSLGKAGDDCRVGKHDLRPTRFMLAAWPADDAS